MRVRHLHIARAKQCTPSCRITDSNAQSMLKGRFIEYYFDHESSYLLFLSNLHAALFKAIKSSLSFDCRIARIASLIIRR